MADFYKIYCEICGEGTRNGVIAKDKEKRDRHFCSDGCLNIRIKEDKKKR